MYTLSIFNNEQFAINLDNKHVNYMTIKVYLKELEYGKGNGRDKLHSTNLSMMIYINDLLIMLKNDENFILNAKSTWSYAEYVLWIPLYLFARLY